MLLLVALGTISGDILSAPLWCISQPLSLLSPAPAPATDFRGTYRDFSLFVRDESITFDRVASHAGNPCKQRTTLICHATYSVALQTVAPLASSITMATTACGLSSSLRRRSQRAPCRMRRMRACLCTCNEGLRSSQVVLASATVPRDASAWFTAVRRCCLSCATRHVARSGLLGHHRRWQSASQHPRLRRVWRRRRRRDDSRAQPRAQRGVQAIGGDAVALA